MPKDFDEALERMKTFYSGMSKLDIHQNDGHAISSDSVEEERKEAQPKNILMGKKRPYKEVQENFTGHEDSPAEEQV